MSEDIDYAALQEELAQHLRMYASTLQASYGPPAKVITSVNFKLDISQHSRLKAQGRCPHCRLARMRRSKLVAAHFAARDSRMQGKVSSAQATGPTPIRSMTSNPPPGTEIPAQQEQSMSRTPADLARELTKVLDTLDVVDRHFTAEAQMNAALHMAANVRPAPLAAAVTTAKEQLDVLIGELEEGAG